MKFANSSFQHFAFASLVMLGLCIIPPQTCEGQQSENLQTPYEASGKTRTPEYADGIAFYEKLARGTGKIKILKFGRTDSGHPLHLVLYSNDGTFNVKENRKRKRSILLINNAIHPGEPDGIDASMMLLRDIVENKLETKNERLDKVLLAIIPYYNIGGVLNRNSTTRSNQQGPDIYGFRGNARNFDLNRDFIKCDTNNARTFAEIFHFLDPDVLIDTHVSNGSDFQYVMTISQSQKDKLGGVLGKFLNSEMEPAILAQMETRKFPTVPYVNVFGATPDKGFPQFLETPRYSSGYVALFQTIAFMTETHALKPHQIRVEATYQFIDAMIDYLATNGAVLQAKRKQAREDIRTQSEFPLTWKVDRSNPSELMFKGYEGRLVKSRVTSGKKLVYDRTKPFEKKINFYNNFLTDRKVVRPKAYLIPQAWYRVIQLLKLNKVEMREIERDQKFEVEVYSIKSFSSRPEPYEGHYFHDDVELKKSLETVVMYKGDVIVGLDQPNVRYIVETLEPEGSDSFFRWNFFDTILQRKEYFSPYSFEDKAERLLENDAELKRDFEERKRTDAEFAKDTWLQLDFLFRRSPHYEKAHKRYPIYRVLNADK